jgi:hypothetical protein
MCSAEGAAWDDASDARLLDVNCLARTSNRLCDSSMSACMRVCVCMCVCVCVCDAFVCE